MFNFTCTIEEAKNQVEAKYTVANGYEYDAKVRARIVIEHFLCLCKKMYEKNFLLMYPDHGLAWFQEITWQSKIV